jgi:hypothetical protein
MTEFRRRQWWFAAGAVAVALVLLIVSGFQGLAWLGLSMAVWGAVHFLFIRSSFEGSVVSEAYGEPGEELWEFRSFFFMVLGPLVALAAILL